jgi:trimeric autotransporter adhesin
MRRLCFVVVLAAGCSKLLGVDDVQRRDAGVFSTLAQEAYIKASNTGARDEFGGSVALSADGSTLAVAAPFEASAAIGIGGNQADESLPNAGAVYVFTRVDASWNQQAYIKASNTGSDDRFGGSIALSADGSTLVVGARGEDSADFGIGGNENDNSRSSAGAVYVFTRNGTTWAQQAYVKASNTGTSDYFGSSVALSADGTILAVGATGEASSAAGVGGNQNDDSSSGAGAVYVFTRSGTVWSQQTYIKAFNPDPDDRFGGAIALSADGLTLAVGARDEDSAATGVGGNQADNSAPSAGAVYVYTRKGTMWSQQAYIKASNTDAGDFFGQHIALSADGSTLVVGAPFESSAATGTGGDQLDDSANGAGAVYVFLRDGIAWIQHAYVKASNTDRGDAFCAVALSSDGSILAVGAAGESSAATGIGGDQADNSATGAGAVYLFVRQGVTWGQQAYVKATNTNASDFFGGDPLGDTSVTLSGDGATLAVGAPPEGSAATGINGNQGNNAAPHSGAVYVFR